MIVVDDQFDGAAVELGSDIRSGMIGRARKQRTDIIVNPKVSARNVCLDRVSRQLKSGRRRA